MLVFPQMDPTNFPQKFQPKRAASIQMETKQQEPQEEEIPIRAMVALKISRKCPWRFWSTLWPSLLGTDKNPY